MKLQSKRALSFVKAGATFLAIGSSIGTVAGCHTASGQLTNNNQLSEVETAEHGLEEGAATTEVRKPIHQVDEVRGWTRTSPQEVSSDHDQWIQWVQKPSEADFGSGATLTVGCTGWRIWDQLEVVPYLSIRWEDGRINPDRHSQKLILEFDQKAPKEFRAFAEDTSVGLDGSQAASVARELFDSKRVVAYALDADNVRSVAAAFDTTYFKEAISGFGELCGWPYTEIEEPTNT